MTEENRTKLQAIEDIAPSGAEAPAQEEPRKTSDQILRERREAARGPAPIDRDIHMGLPLTRAFPVVLAVAVLCYVASIIGGRLGIEALFYGGRWACSLLFLVAVVVWFISRHQAKKLTEESRPKPAKADSGAPAASAKKKRRRRKK